MPEPSVFVLLIAGLAVGAGGILHRARGTVTCMRLHGSLLRHHPLRRSLWQRRHPDRSISGVSPYDQLIGDRVECGRLRTSGRTPVRS
jgi:hypothetical protein